MTVYSILLFLVAALLAWVLALWGASGMAVSLIVLFAGLLVSFILLYRVQKEFNGGLF